MGAPWPASLTTGRPQANTASVARAVKGTRGRPRKRDTKLSEWIDNSGMTRDHVATELGIARSHLDKLCRGETGPGLALAFAIERLSGGAIQAAEWVQDSPQRK